MQRSDFKFVILNFYIVCYFSSLGYLSEENINQKKNENEGLENLTKRRNYIIHFLPYSFMGLSPLSYRDKRIIHKEEIASKPNHHILYRFYLNYFTKKKIKIQIKQI